MKGGNERKIFIAVILPGGINSLVAPIYGRKAVFKMEGLHRMDINA